MSSIKLKGSSSGDVTITVPAAAGTNTVTIPALTGTLPLSNLDHVTNRQNAKPLVINGDMAVAQRGTSTTGITGGGYYTVDRMKVDLNDNGTWTHTQDTDVPTGQGFAKSWKLDNTTADTSVASGSYHLARYLFEGQDLQLLKKGTSSAEKVTVSFWIKATVTGTYIAELFDVDNSRQISQAYTVSSANTWEKKVLSFAGDTSGALGDDNGSSFAINFWLGAGSDFSSGTLSTTWTSSTNANRAVGQVNSGSSTSNNVYFTGLQMEVGEYDSTTIPPFQHESFGDSLMRCERYCKAIIKEANYAPVMLAHGVTADVCRGAYFFQTPMRAAPSFTHTGNIIRSYEAATALSSATAVSSRFAHSIDWTGSGLFAANEGILITFNTTAASLIYDAEL